MISSKLLSTKDVLLLCGLVASDQQHDHNIPSF